MKHLKQQWKTRTSIVLVVSVLVSLLFRAHRLGRTNKSTGILPRCS